MNKCAGLVLLTFILTIAKSVNGLNACNDWVSYNDEKCFKVIEKSGTEAEAESNCKQLDSTSTLLTIHSKEEQDFVSNLLANYLTKSERVWIGLKLFGKAFKWMDDTNMDYKNWAQGSPDPTNPGACVQMSLVATSIGKWNDESCGKLALIVCQKKQDWTLSMLKTALENVTNLVIEQQYEMSHLKTIIDNLNNTITLKTTFDSITTQLNNSIIDKDNKIKALDQNLKTTAESLRQSSVPIGFTYVQLSSEAPPQQIWPTMTWNDVTSAYAGVFFRAEGGGSGAFGQVQPDNSPRLVEVNTIFNFQLEHDTHVDNVSLPIGAWSNWIFTGDDAKSANGNRLTRFHISDGEVRPRNMAIRVWRRTK